MPLAWLYRVLEIAGGFYLAYIGIQSFRHAKDPLIVPEGGNSQIDLSQGRAFGVGFTTNLANPKVMIFFASIFSTILKPGTALWVRVTAISIVFLNETLWDGGVGLLLSTRRAQRMYARGKVYIERAAGTLMSLFDLRLLLGATTRAFR
jgi:threonine efflux protein